MRLLLFPALFVASVMLAFGGEVTEVPKGALRTQLFDLARPTVEEAAGGHAVMFKGSLTSTGTWAFFKGEIVDKAGKSIKVGEGESSDTAALWKQTGGKWTLVTAVAGFTDVIYLDWAKEYGAPAALID